MNVITRYLKFGSMNNGTSPPLHKALAAMMKDLEVKGPNWRQSERDRWFHTFETSLNYAYPCDWDPVTTDIKKK